MGVSLKENRKEICFSGCVAFGWVLSAQIRMRLLAQILKP